ncbi:ATP-sensitive inward rectifier potassium channel 12-like isoform X2 [Panulirus ornatus]|uniref:ATP-sensitive inward rectifier potassium channel 12-like isoform X2 n=1 Tax=Panulirus ornatus TaxID=150431 RepID=UPI003A86B644
MSGAMRAKQEPVPARSSTMASITSSSDEDAHSDIDFSLLDPIKLSLCQEHMMDEYRHTRISSKKMRKRVVQKNGECNVSPSNVAKRRRRYLQDIFTTLVDIQWRWTLLVFAMSFISSWLMFAFVWWIIAYTHGDLQEENLPEKQEESQWTPCVMNIVSFTSCFLFSVETQHTIGYGSRHTTEECPEAIFVMCIQSITGVMIQAFMVGIVFAKLSRPKKRTQTLMFSRNACLCLRDGEMCLLFRVGDMRKSHIIEAHVRAQLIRKRVTREGEVLPFFQYELDVGYDIGEDRIFFIWPMTIVHKINENSPLYDLSAHDLLREKFEIVVILEGVIESTGMTTQARSSYLPNEILWGYRFEPLVTFNKELGEYAVDYSLFNNTYQVNTPLYSARELDRLNSQESTPVTPPTPATPMSPLTPMTPPSGSGGGSCALDLHACPHSCEGNHDSHATQPLLQEHDDV